MSEKANEYLSGNQLAKAALHYSSVLLIINNVTDAIFVKNSSYRYLNMLQNRKFCNERKEILLMTVKN